MKTMKLLIVILILFSCEVFSSEPGPKRAPLPQLPGGRIYADATTDTGFKELLSDLDVAKSIINCFVPDFEKDQIEELRVLSPAIPRLKVGTEKQVFMDYHAITKQGQHVVIEMQKRRHIMFDERALFYLCHTYADQLSNEALAETAWYLNLKKVYAINFVDYDTNNARGIESDKSNDTLIDRVRDNKMGDTNYIKHYMFTDQYSKQVIDHLQLIQVELPRADRILGLGKFVNELNTGEKLNIEKEVSPEMYRKLWLTVMKRSTNLEDKAEGNMPEDVTKGLGKLKYSGWKEETKTEYVKEVSEEEIYAADINDKVQAARDEGLEKGLAKGREEGAAIGASRMAFSTMMEDFVEYGDIRIRKSARLMRTTESELQKIWTEAGLDDDKFDEFIEKLKEQKGDLIASDEEMK